jgi:hypothetical protein
VNTLPPREKAVKPPPIVAVNGRMIAPRSGKAALVVTRRDRRHRLRRRAS